jgi:hypothetical protein
MPGDLSSESPSSFSSSSSSSVLGKSKEVVLLVDSPLDVIGLLIELPLFYDKNTTSHILTFIFK